MGSYLAKEIEVVNASRDPGAQATMTPCGPSHVCRHRGNRLVGENSEAERPDPRLVARCGWRYALDGTLVHRT